MTSTRCLLVLLLVLLAPVTAACGGSDSEAPQGTTSAPTAADASAEDGTTVVAALGDSITAGSPLWDPDPAIRAQIGPALDEHSQFEYWASEGDPSLEFRNCGVFGERTDEIAQRLDSCAEGADVLLIQGGINDIAQGRSVEAAGDDIASMIERGREMGLPVAVIDVLPWNNGHPAADAPIEELNRQIEAAAEDQGVPVLPFHDTLEDPAEPGVMRADLTIDGDHPSVAGYRLLAEEAVAGPLATAAKVSGSG